MTGAIAYAAWMLAQPAAAEAATSVVEPTPAPAPVGDVAHSPGTGQVEPSPAPVEAPASEAPARSEAAPPSDATVAGTPVASPEPAPSESSSATIAPAPAAEPVQPVGARILAPAPIPTESGAFVLVPVGPPPRVQPVPPDVTIRRWHRSAGALIGVAGASLVGSFALQALRQAALRGCGASTSCHQDAYGYEPSLGSYTVLLHGMTVAAAGGAGAMLGNADATHDVHARGRAVRKPGLMALGVVMTTVGAVTYAGVGMSLWLRQMDGQYADPASAQLRRFLLVDPIVVGTAAGAGLIGYAARRKRQGEALAKVRVTAGASGIGVAGQF